MRYIRTLMTWAVALGFDLRQRLIDCWQVQIRHRHRQVLRESEGTHGEAAPGRLAVVALYPSNDSLPFTLNLLDALAKAGLWVLVVSSRRLSATQLSEVAARSHRIIERPNIGQDFGSYQRGIEWLREHRQLEAAELLILANDSMFYPKAIAIELQKMLQKPNEWQSLFENHEFHYHAQSFFLFFRSPVLRSDAFWDFWRRYKPYSSRIHAIHKGELGLSRCLKKEGFVCEAAYSSVRLAEALAEEPLSLEQLSEIAPFADRWDVSMRKVFNSAMELGSVEPARGEPGSNAPPHANIAAGDRSRHVEKMLSKFWSFWLAHQFESANPTHAGALICNRLFAAPIKRDVCFRGILDIHQMLRWAAGFDGEEMAAMHRDLRARGLGWRMSGVRRMLYTMGRI